METSSSPAPVRFTLVPIKIHYKLGKLQGYSYASLEQAKAISKSASRLKRFRNTPLPIRDPARMSNSKNTFSWGEFDVADVRESMVAGDFELFFAVLALYGPRGHYACLSDPTILGMTQGWWEAANSGNKTARALLRRISPALARADYRRPPLSATEPRRVHQDASSNSKAVARLLKRFQAEVGDGRSPQHAYENTVRNYCESSRMTGARKDFALAAFDTKVMALHPGLHSLVGRTIWRTRLPREG